MAVDVADPAWGEHLSDRRKVADMFSGRDDSLKYIRTLPGFDEPKTKSYREGAYFLPIVARTVEAFGGLVFAKTPVRTVPDALSALLSDVTGSGQDIDRFAEQSFDGVLGTGAIMVLVDHPEAPADLTIAEAEAKGIRPVLRLYDSNAILSARPRTRGGTRVLGHVRVIEIVEEESDTDEFAVVLIKQVRVLDLDPSGAYRQRVFRSTTGSWAQHGATVEPKKSTKRLDHIPAYFSNTRDGEPTPAKPPITDLAELSIAHLNNSAALEWALLWTANPTPVFKGLNLAAGEVVKLGSSEGIAVTEGGDAKFMEFTGAGLSELRLALDAKRKDAAMMGARMLLETNKQAVAAETARIQRAGETSVVAGIANALSDCLTKALNFMAEWAGIGGKVEYWLNTDLNPAGISPQMLAQLLAAVMSGNLSRQSFYALMQQNEIVDPAKSFEDHEEEIAEDGEGRGTVDD